MEDAIKELSDGNHFVYKQLFDKWYEPLCRYAFSILKDMDEAEDVVQKTFCKLWDNRKTINIQSSINSYLYRMVHNDCLNTVHQLSSHKIHNLNYISSMTESVDNVNDQLVASELQQAIEKALMTLPTQCKRVFELSRNEQLSYNEIAKKLNISTNTVENHISKALKLLRVELKDFLALLFFLQLID